MYVDILMNVDIYIHIYIHLYVHARGSRHGLAAANLEGLIAQEDENATDLLWKQSCGAARPKLAEEFEKVAAAFLTWSRSTDANVEPAAVAEDGCAAARFSHFYFFKF